MRRYVIYQRVSTDEQANEGYSLEAMLEKCRYYIKSQPDSSLVKVFEDKGFSGTLEPNKRPALNQLLTEMKNKELDFDTILIWKLDRLSRSIRDTLNLEYMLRKNNKSLESVTERIDTSTASGKMFFNTIASFAEFESAQIGERTLNAMSSKVGQISLGGKAPIGYRYVNNKLHTDLNSAHIVSLIFKQFLKIRNLSRVANMLNKKGICTSFDKKWSHKKIKRILINPVYLGHTVWNKRYAKLGCLKSSDKWIVREKTHEGIIPYNTFEKVQRIMRRSHRGQDVQFTLSTELKKSDPTPLDRAAVML